MEQERPEDVFVWPGRPVPVPSREFAERSIPIDRATFSEICWFAASFDGYTFLESESLGALANTVRDYFARLGFMPDALDLETLRACLFFEYRRFHHFGYRPGESDARYLRALIAAIRARVAAAAIESGS